MSRFVAFAAMAGAFGALSGATGKVSVGEAETHVAVRVGMFALNGVCTAQMWRYYLKALSLGSTPVAQMVSTGTNFAVSAVLGILFFGEIVTMLWGLGALVTCVGLALIASSEAAPSEAVKG